MSTVRLFSSAACWKSSLLRMTKRPFWYSYPLTSSSQATGVPSRAQTRSNLIGDLSSAWSMRKRGRESRTAVCSSTGILTSPNAMEPFQSARGMQTGVANATPVCRSLLGLQFALSFEPVVEITTIAAAAAQIALVGRFRDLFIGRAGHRYRHEGDAIGVGALGSGDALARRLWHGGRAI